MRIGNGYIKIERSRKRLSCIRCRYGSPSGFYVVLIGHRERLTYPTVAVFHEGGGDGVSREGERGVFVEPQCCRFRMTAATGAGLGYYVAAYLMRESVCLVGCCYISKRELANKIASVFLQVFS